MKLHNIKKILEERRIEVSESSWDQLASQLDANDKKTKRRNIYPYAACIAVLVGLITFMVSKSFGESQSQTIVGTDEIIKIEEEIKTPKPVIFKEEINNDQFKDAMVVNEETTYPKQTTTEKEAFKKEQLTPKQRKETIVELQKEIKNTVVVQEIKKIPKEIETIITEKEVVVNNANEELKASIMALSAFEKVTITDAEIDQMLKEAQRSLSELNIKKEQDLMRFATADELLNEVEYELDKSFKQKVFDLVKKNVKKGKTLLADRN